MYKGKEVCSILAFPQQRRQCRWTNTHCRASSWGSELRSERGYVLLVAPTSAMLMKREQRVDGTLQHEMQANSSPSLPKYATSSVLLLGLPNIKPAQSVSWSLICQILCMPMLPAIQYAGCSWIHGATLHHLTLTTYMDLHRYVRYMFVYSRTISAYQVCK